MKKEKKLRSALLWLVILFLILFSVYLYKIFDDNIPRLDNPYLKDGGLICIAGTDCMNFYLGHSIIVVNEHIKNINKSNRIVNIFSFVGYFASLISVLIAYKQMK